MLSEPSHRRIRVTLPFPIYDATEREEAIEREQLRRWGAMHASCYGGVCHAHSEPYCHSNHQPRTYSAAADEPGEQA